MESGACATPKSEFRVCASRYTDRMALQRRPPENLPDSPGVYLFKGARGKILYVGKARL